jgi:hypothetical protein
MERRGRATHSKRRVSEEAEQQPPALGKAEEKHLATAKGKRTIYLQKLIRDQFMWIVGILVVLVLVGSTIFAVVTQPRSVSLPTTSLLPTPTGTPTPSVVPTAVPPTSTPNLTTATAPTLATNTPRLPTVTLTRTLAPTPSPIPTSTPIPSYVQFPDLVVVRPLDKSKLTLNDPVVLEWKPVEGLRDYDWYFIQVSSKLDWQRPDCEKFTKQTQIVLPGDACPGYWSFNTRYYWYVSVVFAPIVDKRYIRYEGSSKVSEFLWAP